MNKKLRAKKNNLRKRAYHIIISDRNGDEIKRRNQTHEVYTKINEKLNKAFNNFSTSIKSSVNIFKNGVDKIWNSQI